MKTFQSDLQKFNDEEILLILLTSVEDIKDTNPRLYRETINRLCENHDLPEPVALFDLN